LVTGLHQLSQHGFGVGQVFGAAQRDAVNFHAAKNILYGRIRQYCGLDTISPFVRIAL
jgi:hypothetical protein